MPPPTIIYDFDPRNLPPELLQALGLVVAAAAQTELVVQDLIGSLLKIDNIETRALTAQMSASLKDQIARSSIELSAPSVSEVDRLDELLDDINRANDRRNMVLHNTLARHPETGEVFRYKEKARGSLEIVFQPVRAEDVEKDAIMIYDAGMALMSFMISRGLGPYDRTKPIYAPLPRGTKARADRRDKAAGASDAE